VGEKTIQNGSQPILKRPGASTRTASPLTALAASGQPCMLLAQTYMGADSQYTQSHSIQHSAVREGVEPSPTD